MARFYYTTAHKSVTITTDHIVDADDIMQAAEVAQMECDGIGNTLLEVRNFLKPYI